MSSIRNVLVVSLLFVPLYGAQALTLASNTILVTDPASGGSVEILSEVFDNFAGDFSKYEFRYTVDNLSFDPTPGTSNGLSGFQEIFTGSVPGIADQYGPPGWFFNCCGGAPPPFGAEWDIDNTSGFGIPIGGTDFFGFSAPAGTLWTDSFTGSWMHSWEFDTQVNIFNLADNSSGLSILSPVVPEPATGMLLGLALAGLAYRRRRV